MAASFAGIIVSRGFLFGSGLVRLKSSPVLSSVNLPVVAFGTPQSYVMVTGFTGSSIYLLGVLEAEDAILTYLLFAFMSAASTDVSTFWFETVGIAL